MLTGWSARWADLPLAYAIGLIPFLVCAAVDDCLKNAQFWERAIVSAIVGFMALAVALPVASSWLFPRIGLGISILAISAIGPAILCSLLSMPRAEPPNLTLGD
jgi:hypothetical protein